MRALVYLPPTAECWPEDTSLRFRVEVSGFDGFHDRGYFEVPLDCTVVGTQGLAPMPGEVPRKDEPGVREAMRLTRQVAPGGQSLANLVIQWDPAAGAESYSIWRGSLLSLYGGTYDHSIAAGQISRCNLAEMDPLDLPGVYNTRTLVDEGIVEGWSESPHTVPRPPPPTIPPAPFLYGSYYWLVTASASCPSGMTATGTAGFADPDLDGIDEAADERPAGASNEPGCQP